VPPNTKRVILCHSLARPSEKFRPTRWASFALYFGWETWRSAGVNPAKKLLLIFNVQFLSGQVSPRASQRLGCEVATDPRTRSAVSPFLATATIHKCLTLDAQKLDRTLTQKLQVSYFFSTPKRQSRKSGDIQSNNVGLVFADQIEGDTAIPDQFSEAKPARDAVLR
jgi:hypothetical protein